MAEPVGKPTLACERDVLRQLGYDIAIPEVVSIRTGIFNEDTMRILEETVRKIPLEAVKEISAFGAVEDCIEKIESFVEAGATHIVISNLGPDYDNVMELMKEEIMPYFRKR